MVALYEQSVSLLSDFDRAAHFRGLEEKAAHGAKFLDYVDQMVEEIAADSPKAWFMRVSPEKLDIMDIKNCVLGQLYGFYFTGLEALSTLLEDFTQDVELVYMFSDRRDHYSSRFGFDGSGRFLDTSYLTKYWIREIETRKHKLVKENAME